MSNTELEDGIDKENSDSSSNLAAANGAQEPQPLKGKAINAQSWSLGMKYYHTAVPCFLSFVM